MKTIRGTIVTLIATLSLLSVTGVHAECYGEGEYTVCSDVETDADGDVHAKAWDTDGNTYQVDTESRPYLNGHVIESSDSDGNSYSIKTWTDRNGSHSEDSDGNVCTVTWTGQMIGCAQ